MFESAARCSIDRLVLLVRMKAFVRDTERGDFMAETRQRDKVSARFDEYFRHIGRDVLDRRFANRDTLLYLYHCRSLGGVDFQYVPKFPVREKLDVKALEKLGKSFPSDMVDRGYIYEYFDNEFGFRIEYNPNKQDPMEVKRCLEGLGVRDLEKDIRVSRIDIAIDYPCNLDVSLLSIDGLQKFNGFWDKEIFNGLYFGSMNSPLRFRVYDKYLERKREGVKVPMPLWRVELEYKEPFFFYEFKHKMLCAFDRVRWNFGGLKSDDPVVDLILFKARHFGLTVALHGFSKYERAKYMKIIESLNTSSLVHPSVIFRSQFHSVWEIHKERILESFKNEIR